MKQNFKRGISLLLTLVLFVGLLSGVSLPVEAATVNYVYSGNYVYNWGQRGTTATFMSPMAEDFYAKASNRSYDYLSSLSGSSSESGVPSSALYKQLKSIMSGAATKTTSYEATKELFRYTDCQNSGGKISSFYSGKLIGPGWDGAWNREHTWPNSKGNAAGDGENDLMMLRPTSTSENSSRGNKAYGNDSGYYDPNSYGYDLRGDVARIVLFTYTRWGCTNTGSDYNPNGIFGTNGVIESKQVLLDWIEADPVDTWELGRNDACQSILGTRNIFVDYPELAFVLWGEEIPSDMTTPSGEAKSGAVSYTITATSNNTSYGTVSVSGKTINASPKTGYYAAGYTVVSGSAQVTQVGNAFTVVASSNCTIRINFKAKDTISYAFYEDGTKATTKTAYAGDNLTLPSHTTAVPTGYKFEGWVTSQVEESDKKPATIYAAGSSYPANAAVSFYALYSKFDSEGSGSSSNTFELYSGAITEGDYVIYIDDNIMKAAVKDGRLDYTEATPVSNKIEAPAADTIWHISANGSGYYTLYNESTGQYAAGTGTRNKGTVTSTVDDLALWSVTVKSEGYDFVNKAHNAKGINDTLRYNPGYGFATYASTFKKPLKLYKAISGSTTFTTQVSAPCTHENQVLENVKEATCTSKGYTGDLYCDDCGELLKVGTATYADHVFVLIGDEATCSGCGGVAEGDAFLNGTVYDTVDEALEVATAGQTIFLLAHCDSYYGIYLEEGVCLDLNGHMLQTDSVLSYGSIIDSSNGEGGLSTLDLLMENSEQLVLWDEDAFLYRFYDYELVSLGTKTMNGGVRFGFALEMTNKDAYALLAQQGNGGLKVSVTMQVGSTTKTFAFSSELLSKYAQLQQQDSDLRSAMMLRVTGLEALSAGQSLKVIPSVTMSDAAFVVSGEEMTYTK